MLNIQRNTQSLHGKLTHAESMIMETRPCDFMSNIAESLRDWYYEWRVTRPQNGA
jgi:hypothetical protein